MKSHPSVRAAIAANVLQSRAISKEILATSGPDRHAARERKRRLGRDTRVLLLALAFLRGVPYARVESPRTASRPDPHDVAGAAGGAVTAEAARAWLAPAPTPVERREAA